MLGSPSISVKALRTTSGHRLVRSIWLAVLISLTGAGSACQTGNLTEKKENQEDSILESQKDLIRAALDSGKPEQALAGLRDLIRKRPDDASLQSLMGLTQLALKNSQRAVYHFRTAYKLNPIPAIALNLSSAYIENGDYDRAIDLLTPMLAHKNGPQAYPYRERLYHNIGYANVRKGLTSKAISWFREALAENPTFFPSHFELANIYERTGRTAMAIKAYRRSIDYCLQCFEPVKALANIYMKAGNPVEARQVLLRFTRTDGIQAVEKTEANRLLKIATASGLNRPQP